MARAAKAHLTAVSEPVSASGEGFRSVTAAAQDGTRRDLLVAMRSRVATAVEDPDTPPRDLAALTRRLLEIAKEIEAIDKAEEEEGRDGSATPDEEWNGSAI